ncbi:MAG: hypothetical protein ACPIOQ_09935, partial [Promethearchaeia archaeon]
MGGKPPTFLSSGHLSLHQRNFPVSLASPAHARGAGDELHCSPACAERSANAALEEAARVDGPIAGAPVGELLQALGPERAGNAE